MLSLIAIAKNEAAEITAFLEHHRDLFDEMVLVDTGSTDDTVALAEAAGARVLHHEWDDDFAAARNASLAAATGDWAFVLDIDERIARSDFSTLREATLGSRDHCYLCAQWNYYNRQEHQEWQPVSGRYPDEERGQTGFFAAEQYRLLPVRDGLYWEGRVHEDLAPSMERLGLTAALLEVPVHHYGYVGSKEHNDARNEFYGRLVRRKVQENPDDWKARLELAYILIQEGRARESIPWLEELHAHQGDGPILSRVRVMLAKLYAEDDRIDEALQVMQRTTRENPDWLFGWTGRLQLMLSQKDYSAAEPVLNEAKRRFGEDPLLLKIECQILVNTRRIVEAIPVGRRVTELIPSLPEYALIADKCEALARKAGML